MKESLRSIRTMNSNTQFHKSGIYIQSLNHTRHINTVADLGGGRGILRPTWLCYYLFGPPGIFFLIFLGWVLDPNLYAFTSRKIFLLSPSSHAGSSTAKFTLIKSVPTYLETDFMKSKEQRHLYLGASSKSAEATCAIKPRLTNDVI